VKVFPLKRGWKSLLLSMLRGMEDSGVALELLNDDPDIVLDTGSQLWVAIVQRMLRRRIPFAEVIHDAIPHPGPRYLMYVLFRLIYRSWADVLVALSGCGYEVLKKQSTNKYLIQTRHGIILANASINSSLIAANRNKMLFFGQITVYKGINTLVKAYELAKQNNPDIELDIVGAGKIASDIREKINNLGIGLVNEYVPNDEVKKLFSSHGVLLMPYDSATQSGVASVALANGLPCIATDVGALPEQVKNGKNGIIVTPRSPEIFASAMLEIASDYNKALSMSLEAVKLAQTEYSWNQIGGKLVDDLDDILEKSERLEQRPQNRC
jgi:glycosyltransferase involved in cell wall biosynthesis